MFSSKRGSTLLLAILPLASAFSPAPALALLRGAPGPPNPAHSPTNPAFVFSSKTGWITQYHAVAEDGEQLCPEKSVRQILCCEMPALSVGLGALLTGATRGIARAQSSAHQEHPQDLTAWTRTLSSREPERPPSRCALPLLPASAPWRCLGELSHPAPIPET